MNLDKIQTAIISFWQRFGQHDNLIITLNRTNWHSCIDSFSAYLFDVRIEAIQKGCFYYMGMKVIYSDGLNDGEIVVGV